MIFLLIDFIILSIIMVFLLFTTTVYIILTKESMPILSLIIKITNTFNIIKEII